MPLGSPVPAALYAAWSETFGAAIGAAHPARGVRDVRTDDRHETVPVHAVTPGLFEVLGVRPVIGRTFSSSAPASSGPQPAVISYRIRHTLFDGRDDVLGRSLWIDRTPYTVIGVMPARFWFSEMASPVWTVLDYRAAAPDQGLEVVVRRPPGVSAAMLDAQLQGTLAAYARRLPASGSSC
jgi:putative ABC transport system permease protein